MQGGCEPIALTARGWNRLAWADESNVLAGEYEFHIPLPTMLTVLKIGSLLVGACAALTITPISADESPREHLSLDANWRFHLGDDWPDALRLDKAGIGGGAGRGRIRG